MSLPTALVLLGLLGSGPDERAVVPVELQAELLAKVLAYDRNFPARAGPEARVLVVYAVTDPESQRIARELVAALDAQPLLGGVAHREELVAFESMASLAALAKARRASLVAFAPGLAARAGEAAASFEGCDCLTVSTTPEGVREGFVLGFDLVSGKPRMTLNLSQARRQRSAFRAEVLQLMTVYP